MKHRCALLRALAAMAFATILGGIGTARAADLASPSKFGDSDACKALRTKYPSLVGKDLSVGLGGYTIGFEAPSAADPTKIVGLDPDLFDYMAACLGFKYTLHNGSFNVLLTSVTSGRIDIGPSLYVTEPRLKQVAFVSNFSVIDGSVVRKGNPKHLTSLDSLCGATVTAAAGTYEAVSLIPPLSAKCKAAGKPEIGMLLMQNTDTTVQALLSDRADIYLTADSDAEALAKSVAGLQAAFTVDLPILNGFPIAKSNKLMQDAVLDAMKAIQAAGIEKVLLDRWGQGAASERPAAING
jgi:polar amino acid transport system substrate-binding protein